MEPHVALIGAQLNGLTVTYDVQSSTSATNNNVRKILVQVIVAFAVQVFYFINLCYFFFSIFYFLLLKNKRILNFVFYFLNNILDDEFIH